MAEAIQRTLLLMRIGSFAAGNLPSTSPALMVAKACSTVLEVLVGMEYTELSTAMALKKFSVSCPKLLRKSAPRGNVSGIVQGTALSTPASTANNVFEVSSDTMEKFGRVTVLL